MRGLNHASSVVGARIGNPDQAPGQKKSVHPKADAYVQYGAGDGIRTRECKLGKLVPYHLATPACEGILAQLARNARGIPCIPHATTFSQHAAERGHNKSGPKAARDRRMRIYLVEPMRQIVVPQSGHLPLVIGLPFFVVLSTGSFMIFFALHFMQYASIAMSNLNSVSTGLTPSHTFAPQGC